MTCAHSYRSGVAVSTALVAKAVTPTVRAARNALTKLMEGNKRQKRVDDTLARIDEREQAIQREADLAAKQMGTHQSGSAAEDQSNNKLAPLNALEQPEFELHWNRPFKRKWLLMPQFQCFFELRGRVFCAVCQRNKVATKFSNSGKSITDSWYITQLKQHIGEPLPLGKENEITLMNEHQLAVYHETENKRASERLRTTRLNVLASIRSTLHIVIRLVYWLALENVAMLKLSSLFGLCVGLPGFTLGKLPQNYINSCRCREFVMAISAVIKGKLWDRILQSPYVAVMIDESTDVSTSENLIVYIAYVYNGRAHVTYVGIVHAPAVDAESLHDQLKEYLEQHGLDLSKVMCFCSDGASVMTGSQNGVGVRLQRSNPFMVLIHCIAHRLALCCADASVDMDYPENEESTLNEVSSHFNRSGKRTTALKELVKKFALGQTKIVKSGKTRWLSRAGYVAVVVKLYHVLVQVFSADTDN